MIKLPVTLCVTVHCGRFQRMTNQQFEAWLFSEVTAGRMPAGASIDLQRQKALFDANRNQHYATDRGKVIGYAGDLPFVGATVHEVLDQVKQRFPGKLAYFEPIGFDLF